MKDNIHTIPVLDALREQSMCPFCIMYQRLDENATDFIMGPAYMDEDIRDKTNDAGFCGKHLQKLYAAQNRLGMALLLHTHFKKIQEDLKTPKNLDIPTGFFKKGESAAGQFSKRITALQSRCYLCEKIDETFARYMDTFFYLWPKEKEIITLVEALPGFCLPHYGMMLEAAEKTLNKKHLEGFLNIVLPLQQRALEKIECDLDWFIQKFDYRNAEAPWKDSKDAVNKTMAALKGSLVYEG